MKHPIRRFTALLTLALAALLVLAGCQMAPQEPVVVTVVVTATPEAMEPMATAEPEATAMEMEAEMEKISIPSLRVTLDQMLGEHVLLAASATNAALHGRTADFEAAAGALDNNSQDLAATIGSVYGQPAGDAFLALWRTHIGFFVDYTVAVASNDGAAKDAALAALDGYADDFAAFLSSANPQIDPAVVADNLRTHVATLTAVIDAQASDDFPTAFAHLRTAYAHMDSTASYLATSIGAQFPDLFEGSADTPAAGLQSALNTLLAEHVYVASLATDAALGGRNDEFEAAAGSLDNNSQDLAAAVGSVYGEGAGDAFLALWRTHIGFFVDYTVAVATDDAAKKEQALKDLTGYATDFGAFLNSANPDLPVETVATLLARHVDTLTAVIDAQAAGEPVMAYGHLREAYAHMRMIADSLAGSIIAQFPDIFGMDEMGMEQSGMDASQVVMSASQLRVTLDQMLGEHVLLAASATNAALHGRTADFEAAAGALDNNSQDLAATIGSVYGQPAGDAFLALWRTHIGFFVDYTVAVASNDGAAKDAALAALDGYADDFAAFLSSANPQIDPAVVADNLRTHVATLTAVIDAQASDDFPTAFAHLRTAYAHMDSTASYLATSIGAQFPDLFEGSADTPAAGLQSALNTLLAEHVYVASLATDAALGGRNDEFEAAAGSLDNNSQDLAAAVGSVYGEGAGDAFLALWRTHIGFFVDYTVAVATDDAAKKEQALKDLTGYATDFGAFLNSANPDLPVETVATLLARHVDTLTAVIDAQAAGEPVMAYGHLREAYAHMRMIADSLAGSIIAQFPDIFGMDEMGMEQSGMDASQVVMSASQLRATLGGLLGEHVLLAASATDAALRGRTAEFEAAANALDGNSQEIAAAIGLVYGEGAQEAFLALWRTHIGFFVDYTVGVATGDSAKSDKALADLDGYADDFAAFLNSANPNLPIDAVAGLLRSHVTTLVAVIDAQAAKTPQESGDQQTAYTALRAAYAHMDMIATELAGGISAQFPERFPGEAGADAANLRSALNSLLGEHTYLIAKSAMAAINSRTIEFEAAAGSLDQNSQDLAAAVGSVYGEGAGDAFLALWRKHIGFFIDYSIAVGADDAKGQEKARNELVGYATDFAAFLNSANPNLPVDVVEGLVVEHAKTTLAVIEAAGENDPATLYSDLRAAYAHMPMIANPLAGAIIAQFPDIFGMEMPAEMMMEMPGEMAEEKPMEEAPAEKAVAMTVEVDIKTFAFDPAVMEIPVGTTVIWTNRDAVNHTVTSGIPGTVDGTFDSGNFNQDGTFSFTFTEAGSFDYFCQRHNHMRGTIVVK